MSNNNILLIGGILSTIGINTYINYKNNKIIKYYEKETQNHGLCWEAPDELNMNQSNEELYKNCIEICCRLVPKWRSNPPYRSRMKVIVVQGGITNKLYRIIDDENHSVLLRIYGEKTEMLIDRDLENKVFAALTKEQFGPPLIACFNGGRLEGWLNAHALKPHQMSDKYFQKRIANELKLMHHLDIPLKREVTLWNTINKWLKIVENVQFDDKKKSEQFNSLKIDDIANDLNIWKDLLSNSNSPVVFCHNDLLCGNILYDANNDRMYFVDFEYGNYNTRAFDIANHFCEYCGYDLDWDSFPSIEQQRYFYSAYLNCDLNDSLVDQLYDEVKLWYAMPHLFWGLWAIVQACYSSIDFDFLEYASLRLQGYHQERAKIQEFNK